MNLPTDFLNYAISAISGVLVTVLGNWYVSKDEKRKKREEYKAVSRDLSNVTAIFAALTMEFLQNKNDEVKLQQIFSQLYPNVISPTLVHLSSLSLLYEDDAMPKKSKAQIEVTIKRYHDECIPNYFAMLKDLSNYLIIPEIKYKPEDNLIFTNCYKKMTNPSPSGFLIKGWKLVLNLVNKVQDLLRVIFYLFAAVVLAFLISLLRHP